MCGVKYMGAYGSPDLGDIYNEKVTKTNKKPFYKSILFWLLVINVLILSIVGITQANILTLLSLDSVLIFGISVLCIISSLVRKNKINVYIKSMVLSIIVFLVSVMALGSSSDGNSKSNNNEMSESDYKSQSVEVTYDQIAREPNKYKGTYVKIKGNIVQIQDNGSSAALRVNITEEEYNDIVWVNYSYAANEKKLLQDDTINIWGISKGEISYTSILGAKITVPEVNAEYIEIIE